MVRVRLASLAVCLVLGLAMAPLAVAQQGSRPQVDLPPPPITAGMPDADLRQTLDAWLAELVRQDKFSGVVLIAHDGKERVVTGEGLADRSAARFAEPDTVFNVGSIGKIFTATAIAQLVEAKKLSLDDMVGKWLPDHPNAVAKGATIQQLLDHRGGVADIFGPIFRNTPKSDLTSNAAYYCMIAPPPSLFPPGEREEYCNGCHVVLGKIIARVSGISYETYIRDHVFAKAGMTKAGFAPPPGAALPYGLPRPGAELQDVSGFHGAAGSAAGGAYATARDLLAFDNALRDNRLTSPEGTAQVQKAKTPTQGRSLRSMGIAGGAPGVNALLIGDGAWTVIVLANLDPPAAEGVGQAVFKQLAGPRP